VTQYYKTMIENKWSFIKSNDDRKEKQLKISEDAKIETQDKSEVDKRKLLMAATLFNKYLRKRMQEEVRKNDKLETILQNLRKATVGFLYYSIK